MGVGNSMEENTVELHGGKVFYRQSSGESQKHVLMLHGMRFSSSDWARIDALRKISQWGFKVTAVDYPGFGNSEGIPEYEMDESYSSASAFVRDFCGALSISRVTIIGPSMGGAVALRSAMDLHDLVERVIAVAPAGFSEFRSELYRIECPVDLVWGSADKVIDVSYGRRFHDLIAGSSIHIIRGGSHPLYLEKTSQFFSLIKQLLTDE